MHACYGCIPLVILQSVFRTNLAESIVIVSFVIGAYNDRAGLTMPRWARNARVGGVLTRTGPQWAYA